MRYEIIVQNKPANFAGTSRQTKLAAFRTAFLTVAMTLAAFVQQPRAFSETPGVKLNPGDIVYTDSGNAIDGGFVIKVDANTGAKTVLASGGFLQLPFGVVVDASGQIVVSDS